MTKPTLLVADDEPGILFSLSECLSSDTLEVLTASNGREVLEQVHRKPPSVVLLDVRLPDQSGLEVFEQIHQLEPRIPVIIMTAYARTETAIDAMRRGAFEYLLKPVDLRLLRDTISRALQVSRLSQTPAVLPADDGTQDDVDLIVGNSLRMQEVYKQIGRIAPQDATVLIVGESGTGKELVARAIYHYSQRANSPFLAMNCAALPETLLESELFGHEQGAFTGADHRRIGKFEQMNGGTIFLDEIGDMSLTTQAKALRLLQNQQFERLGGNQTIATNVRIIAATNRDLQEFVAQRQFRQDLLYRLNGFTILLPPLRERKEDLPVLTQHFLRQFNHTLHKHIVSIVPEAVELLNQHDWPGNVRELRSAIHYAMVHATSDVITADCLPASCLRGGMHRGTTSSPHSAVEPTFDLGGLVQQHLASGDEGIYGPIMTQVDRVVLATVLDHVGGKQSIAAQRLGISRNTLRSKLRDLDLLNDKGGEPG